MKRGALADLIHEIGGAFAEFTPRALLHDVQLWSWTPRVAGSLRIKRLLRDVLTPQERERAARYRNSDDVEGFTVGRAVTRLVMSIYLDASPRSLRFFTTCQHCGDPRHGKPVVSCAGRPAPLSFSFSRTRGRAVLAISAGPVGVDVECVKPLQAVDALTRLVLSDEEYARIRSCDDAHLMRRFWTAWTHKEAYLKGIGLGLGREPARIAIADAAVEGWRRVDDSLHPAPDWWVRTLICEDDTFIAAVAAAKYRPTIRCYTLGGIGVLAPASSWLAVS